MSQARLILAKTESVEDTAEALGASDIIDVSDFSIQRYAGPTVNRNLERTSESNEETINTGPYGEASFMAEAAGVGTGTADTPPPVGFLIAACGFSEVIDATPSGESTTYEVEDSNHDSITLQDYDPDQNLTQTLTGVRGKLSLSMGSNDIPRFSFSQMMGTYARPVQGTPPGGLDWSSWKAALPMSRDNTPLFTLDGFAAVLDQFNIDWGRRITRRDVPGERSTIISKARGQGASGQLTIVAPDIATKNFYQSMESHLGTINKLPIALTHGSAATKRFNITASEFQITPGGISEVETSDGRRGFQISGNFIDYPAIVFD